MDKYCPRCKQTKPVNAFYKNASQHDGRQPYCVECWRGYYIAKREEERAAVLSAAPSDPRFREFARLVNTFRKSNGWTQGQLGTKLGLGGAQIRLWEKGKSLPRQKTVAAFCKLAGVEIPLTTVRDQDGRIPLLIGACKSCGKPFPVYKRGVDHCSKTCGGKTTVSNLPDTALPNGTRSQAGAGYVQIKVNGQWILEHRHVIQQKLGRPLLAHERVHHKNGDRADNRDTNLELWKVKKKDSAGIRAADYHCPGCRCFEHCN